MRRSHFIMHQTTSLKTLITDAVKVTKAWPMTKSNITQFKPGTHSSCECNILMDLLHVGTSATSGGHWTQKCRSVPLQYSITQQESIAEACHRTHTYTRQHARCHLSCRTLTLKNHGAHFVATQRVCADTNLKKVHSITSSVIYRYIERRTKM